MQPGLSHEVNKHTQWSPKGIANCIRKVSETTTESDRELTKDLEMRLAETAPTTKSASYSVILF